MAIDPPNGIPPGTHPTAAGGHLSDTNTWESEAVSATEPLPHGAGANEIQSPAATATHTAPSKPSTSTREAAGTKAAAGLTECAAEAAIRKLAKTPKGDGCIGKGVDGVGVGQQEVRSVVDAIITEQMGSSIPPHLRPALVDQVSTLVSEDHGLYTQLCQLITTARAQSQ